MDIYEEYDYESCLNNMEDTDRQTIEILLYTDHIELVQKGDLTALIELEEETGIVCNDYVCKEATLYGHLDIVKHIDQTSDIDQTNEDITYEACKSGNVALLQYLHEQNYEWHTECIDVTVENNHLETLKYLYSIGLSIRYNIISYAIYNANIEMIKFLQSKGYIINKDNISTIMSANKKGITEDRYLEVLKYLHTQHPTSAKDFRQAQYYGKLKIVKWLYSIECPMKYEVSEDIRIKKFQHDIGLSACIVDCLFCSVNRKRELMRLLNGKDGYGSWLSNDLLKLIIS